MDEREKIEHQILIKKLQKEAMEQSYWLKNIVKSDLNHLDNDKKKFIFIREIRELWGRYLIGNYVNSKHTFKIYGNTYTFNGFLHFETKTLTIHNLVNILKKSMFLKVVKLDNNKIIDCSSGGGIGTIDTKINDTYSIKHKYFDNNTLLINFNLQKPNKTICFLFY